jgi:hypothetical protein
LLRGERFARSVEMENESGARPAVEREECIKWANVLDTLGVFPGEHKQDDAVVAAGLSLARACVHRDAQWLVAHFSPDEVVTRERLKDAMRAEAVSDPRAMFLARDPREGYVGDQLERAARMGYAPAQAMVSFFTDKDRLARAVASAEKGDRLGMYQLASCYWRGAVCTKDTAKALELWREAANLGCVYAAYYLGHFAFGPQDWERFYWWGVAAAPIYGSPVFDAIVSALPSFEDGENARCLHAIAPGIRARLALVHVEATSHPGVAKAAQRVVELHSAMTGRAREALACWSVVGRRLGLVKDVRMVVAKMAWEEAWHWRAGGGERSAPENAP